MNGGSGTGDGRLDLDDLGEVLDAAATVDADVRTEVLDDGRGTSWGERLEDAGITPWLRRHRVAVAVATAACVIVGAGAAAYARWAPPPFDPDMRVTVTQMTPELALLEGDVGFLGSTVGGAITDVDGHARAAYGLTPKDPGDTATYAVLEIAGPAVRASSSRPRSVDGTEIPVAGNVDVILDCTDPAALDPADGSYSLRVSRTDAWGRTLVASVPLDDGATGWPTYVSGRCANEQTAGALELRGVTVRPGPRAASVSLGLDVVNRLPLDVAVTLPEEGGYPQVSSRLTETPIAAGGSARLPLVLEVHDCTAPTLYPIGVADPDDPQQDIVRAEPGSFLVLQLMTQSSRSGESPPPQGGAAVYWSSSTAREIDAALRASCAGAPTQRPTVRVITGSAGGVVVESFPTGNGSADTAAFLVLSVATAGRRVTVLSPTLSPSSYSGSYLSTATAPVLDGRATIPTTLSYDCSGGGYAPPPTIGVVVSTSRGDFPYQLELTSGGLTRAILDGCRYSTEQELVGFGYDPPVDPTRFRALAMPGP